MEFVDVDVLIVGGGAQGLWLLNDLNLMGYRVLLLERETLGCGQTCHSHALIHRGHYYDNMEMMILLNAAAQFWNGFIRRADIKRLNKTPALVGLGRGDERRYRHLWDAAGLRYTKLKKWPDVLRDSKISHLYETEEFSVDASAVVEGLAEAVEHCLYKLDAGTSMAFHQAGERITTVDAIIGAREVHFRPKLVALCAGHQNLALLNQLGAAHDTAGRLRQARRQSTMLCLRSPDLPPLTAVFPIKGGVKGLFVCSRQCKETGHNVWLVSDHNSLPFNPGIGDDGNTDPTPQPEVVGRIIESLTGCIPLFRKPEFTNSLEGCLYTGVTSERELGSGDHMPDCYIEPFSFENVLTIWPTKLTLTPFASNIATRFIRAKLAPPIPDKVKENRWPEIGSKGLPPKRPTIAAETWTKSAFSSSTECKSDWTSFSNLRNKIGTD